MTSGGDAPERDPNAFTLEGSDDGTNFTTLDTRSEPDVVRPRGPQHLQVARDKVATYSYYRLDITAPGSGGLLQLADWDLAVASGSSDPGPMVTATGNGPTHGYNLKQNAGWTGLHAYQYAGKQTVDGDAYETNMVQDGLNIPVGRDSRLSYKVIPFFTNSDMSYPSTYVAVDLHFTDGSYLSRALAGRPARRAADRRRAGRRARSSTPTSGTPRAPILVRSPAGKTIDRILLSYHDPHAKADTEFGGWIDDVAVDPSAPARRRLDPHQRGGHPPRHQRVRLVLAG